MKFSIYDILSNIIPGYLIIFVLLHFFDYSFGDLNITATLIGAYIVGYLNNTISSWCEGILNWSWGGKPSDQLLNGKSIWKVRFYDNHKAREYLTNETKISNPSNDCLFQIAQRYVNLSQNERIKEFISIYAFSRSLIISFIIGLTLMNFKYWPNIILLIISIILILLVWLRAKQRGFYLAREILTIFIGIKGK